MLNACILLKVVPSKADRIINEVKTINGVKKAYQTAGRFDIAIFVEVKDYQELRDLTTQINSLENVRSTETLPEA